MSRALALDTSVAVPFIQRHHAQHRAVRDRLRGAELHLTGHSVAETYAVLTRLPGGARLAPADAADLIGRSFGPPLLLSKRTAATLPDVLAHAEVAGGAVYDAMVGLAAAEAGVPLVTRDARAASTYRAVGVTVELLAQP